MDDSENIKNDEKKFEAVGKAARRRVKTAAIDHEDVRQEAVLNLLKSGRWNKNTEGFEKDAHFAPFNIVRRTLRELKRFQTNKEVDVDLKLDVQDITTEIHKNTAMKIKIILERGSVEEVATFVRSADMNDACYFEDAAVQMGFAEFNGLAEAVTAQSQADSKEKTRLRKVRSRFIRRLLPILGIPVLAVCLWSCFESGNRRIDDAVVSTESEAGDYHSSNDVWLASKTCRDRQLEFEFPNVYGSKTCKDRRLGKTCNDEIDSHQIDVIV